jgi:putative sigma-54 modulation protein
MDIVIRGRNTHVSESLKQATKEKLAKLDRFARGHGRIEVDFFEHRNPRIHDHHEVEVIVHLKGHLVKGHAASTDHFSALDLVIDKVEHQVRKLKERRVSRSHPRRGRVALPPPPSDGQLAGILARDDADGEGDEADVDVARALADDDDLDELEEPARLVRRKAVRIKPMTTDEAALQMELLEHDFFFFTHADSGLPAVLYRRNDGDLGLLEAEG